MSSHSTLQLALLMQHLPLCSVLLQGLLKDQLELAKQTQQNGKTRWTIKPMEEQLSFDKVSFWGWLRWMCCWGAGLS